MLVNKINQKFVYKQIIIWQNNKKKIFKKEKIITNQIITISGY